MVAGGIIPERDRAALLEMGVAAIFGPGARTAEIIQTLSETIEAARRGGAVRPVRVGLPGACASTLDTEC